MIKKIDFWLSRIEKMLTGSLFIGSLLILAWNIFMRKVFHNASTWAEEAIRYAIIWVTFIGSSQCAKAGSHVGIDIILEILPSSCRKYINAISSFITSVFCFLCGFFGIFLTQMVFVNNRVSAAMQMPMWIIYLSIPLGFGLTGIRFILIGIEKLKVENKISGITDDDGNIDISKI